MTGNLRKPENNPSFSEKPLFPASLFPSTFDPATCCHKSIAAEK